MNSHNKNYQITRREAISTLASLPLATLGLTMPGSVVQPTQYAMALAHCSASLEACWELSKSSEPSDVRLAFKRVSQYLSVLETIARNASRYRQEALDLAARYALVKTILGWHCASFAEVIHYAQSAKEYSKEAENIPLQLSALSKLAWHYLYDKKYGLALETAQEAQFLLERQSDSLPPGIRGGTYSTLALMQARNGVPSDIALGKATEVDPGDEVYAFMDFTRSGLPIEVSLIYTHQGNQKKAIKTLEQLIDLDTLVLKTEMYGRDRVSILNALAHASVKAEDRNMERTIHFWTAGIESAKALQSEWGFDKALIIYELMEVAWPGEKRITDLRDLTEPW